MKWCISHRADPAAARLADRHYNRQKIGSPQFAPTGSCVVFLTDCGRGFWITSAPLAEWVKHDWAGAWVNSAFRWEGVGKASQLILDAVSVTRWLYRPHVPALGMITFVNPAKVPGVMVRGERIYGFCYMKAGFKHVGFTKGGLWAWQILPHEMPPVLKPRPRSMHGAPLFDFVLGAC